MFSDFRKSHRLWDNVEKYGGVREATSGNMAAHCRLQARKHTPVSVQQHPHTRSLTRAHTNTHTEIFNTFCFSEVILVAWALFSVNLYVLCLSYFEPYNISVTIVLFLFLVCPWRVPSFLKEATEYERMIFGQICTLWCAYSDILYGAFGRL